MIRRYHVRISGRVQGVFFVRTLGSRRGPLGLTGWVRNLPDGRVEAVFEGEPIVAEAMRDWCRRERLPPAWIIWRRKKRSDRRIHRLQDRPLIPHSSAFSCGISVYLNSFRTSPNRR